MLQTEGGYNASAFTRIKIAEHLRYLPMGYFNSNSIGEISSVTTNTMEALGDIAARVVMLTTQGILETTMIVLMILIFDWRIGLISAAGVFIFFVINSIMQKAGKSDSEKKVQCDTELISQIMEYIQGISEVKSYNLLGKQAKRLNDANEACAKINTKMEFLFVPYHFLQSVVTKITGAVIVACSAYFYINGTMSAVYAIGMTISAFMLYSSLECAGNYSSLLHVVSVCVDKANAILELDTMDIDGKEIKPQNCDIKLDHISFSYDKRKIIDDVSLSIPEKTTTAIVGPSGGGKSTLCNLIARFAIMKDAPVVILDEATANVDPENEKDLMDAIEALTKEKTIIMIAHRLKTVRHADQIVVVDKGRIVQQGTHEQLMTQDGIYKRFVDAREQAVSWKLAH